MKKLGLLLALFLTPCAAFAQNDAQTVVDFQGEFVDQNAAPLSGVLPLEFRVYPNDKSKKAILTEKHFVSIVDGKYVVTLGTNTNALPPSTSLVVAVYLDGKELTRQQATTLQELVPENPRVTHTTKAGTDSGESFRLECPQGYVVTGIEGTTKDGGIQSFKLICSQAVRLNQN